MSMRARMSVMLVGALMLTFAAGTGWAAIGSRDTGSAKVVTLKVSGMTCGGCEAAVQHAARTVDGVITVEADSDKGIARVTYDPSKTTPSAIAKIITEKSGFKAEAPAEKQP